MPLDPKDDFNPLQRDITLEILKVGTAFLLQVFSTTSLSDFLRLIPNVHDLMYISILLARNSSGLEVPS